MDLGGEPSNAKDSGMYYSYMKATMDYIFSQLCIFFPRVSNKSTRGKESTTSTTKNPNHMDLGGEPSNAKDSGNVYYSYMKSYDGLYFLSTLYLS